MSDGRDGRERMRRESRGENGVAGTGGRERTWAGEPGSSAYAMSRRTTAPHSLPHAPSRPCPVMPPLSYAE
jgi:hypothetical protein